MATGALFGGSATRSQNKHLVEFRAGKMSLKGKMVHPDKRKGLMYLYQSDDTLMHFCWQDRKTGVLEDDLIIFPDDCEYKRVPQCTTGRAFVLHLKTSNRKFFIWMQEPKSDKDDEYFKRINEILTNPPTPGSTRSGVTTPGDADLQSLFGNMSQQQLMQLFSNHLGGNLGGNILSSLGGGSSTRSNANLSSRPSSGTPSVPAPAVTTASSTPVIATTTTTASTASQQRIQLQDLQSILSGMNVPVPPEEELHEPNIDLSEALTDENSLEAVWNNTTSVDHLQTFLPTMPEGVDKSVTEQLQSTLTSAQFLRAVSMFSAGMQSGQLGPLLKNFNLSTEAIDAAGRGNLEEFIQTLEKGEVKLPQSTENESKTSEDKKDDKKEDDDNMALD